MHNYRYVIAVICSVLFAAPAVGQPFIEFEIDANKEADPGGVTVINARVVFDAGASEISNDTFALIDAEISVHQRPFSQFAGSVDPDPNSWSYTLDDLEQATLTLLPDSYGFGLIDNDEPFTLLIAIIGSRPAIQPPLTTLPDDPAEYMVNLNAGISGVNVNLSLGGQTTELIEFGNMGAVINRNASIQYTVRVVDDPRIEECTADLNNDGRLDFFDVSVFLQLFQAGCP
ncbi:MAG: hypothetical protein JJ916_10185 [Phycisphaerales bacterium]|nr:hypothetical protein [Phycisphaerales bacterium]